MNLRIQGISESQWPYYRHWLILIALTEAIMIVLSDRLVEIYTVVGVLFLCGFVLRLLKLYPGQDEPLILDFSAVVFAVGFAWISNILAGSGWRYLLILCSSLIIMPHFVYIHMKK